MPASWVMDEDKWKRAKEVARKQGREGEFDYITGIYKQMGGRVRSSRTPVKKAEDTYRMGLVLPQAVKDLKDVLAKAGPHKYIRRTGTKGNYQYVYKEGEGPKGKKVDPKKELKEYVFENDALYHISEKDQKRLGLEEVERGREINLASEHYRIDPNTVRAEKQPGEGGKEKKNWPFPAPDTKKRNAEVLAEITKKYGADSWVAQEAKTAPDKGTALAIFNDMERRKLPMTAEGYKRYLTEKAKERETNKAQTPELWQLNLLKADLRSGQ